MPLEAREVRDILAEPEQFLLPGLPLRLRIVLELLPLLYLPEDQLVLFSAIPAKPFGRRAARACVSARQRFS